MEKKINDLAQKTVKQITSANSIKELNDIRVAVLGKSGELTLVMKNLKDLPNDQKPIVGKYVNEARVKLEGEIAKKQEELSSKELALKLASEKIDISINQDKAVAGSLHPINQTRSKIAEFFISMGFTVASSPEIETDFYNFEALNIPKDHPAREMQDTFFLTENILLRSQTSSGQIRTMEKTQPPIKMISPGRVYRSDDVDATHSPMFHQMEGLVVDKSITMCDLKGILDAFAKNFFGEKTKTRFRPSHFPFTEPSVEVDASCFNCNDKGCRICKGTGWIEILGAGMVNRAVLKNCGIDPDVYTGFAFGMGIDRITNILHGIQDLRVVFENDVRFLKQFK